MKSIIALIILISGTTGMAQIPASLEREMDQYHEKIYKALQILNTEPEASAISRAQEIKQELIVDSQSLLPKLEAMADLSEEQVQAYMDKQMTKPLFQNFMTLLSDQSFLQKMENSPALMKEYMELMVLMDLGASEEEEEMEYE
jgi:hypothetical protein